MVGKFKGWMDKLNIKVMTSKQGQEKVITSDLLYGGHSNNEFKHSFEYLLEPLVGGRSGEGFRRNFKVNVFVQAVYGYSFCKNMIFDNLKEENF